MATGKDEETGQKPRRAAFRPTQEQRAFVAAAAGLRIPRRVICRRLPGAKPGETVSITGHMLTDYFTRELRRLLDKATPGQKRVGKRAAEDEISAGSPLSRAAAPEGIESCAGTARCACPVIGLRQPISPASARRRA